MPDEKRIKDFEPATELLIDDWFAVDSPSQGTRKMQASMFQEGLQTQITTNTENIALHSGQISVLQQGVGNIGDKVDVLGAAVIVEAYSASKLYAVGEDCVYEGVRYKCITAIETPEAFDPNKWQAISIEGELNELNSSLTNYTTYVFEPVLIGYRQGYPLYRIRIDIDNFQCNVGTEVTLKTNALPSGALNPTISDKSFINMISTGTVFSPNCMHFMTYVAGRNIMFRQSFSSSQTWNFRLFVEYGLQN